VLAPIDRDELDHWIAYHGRVAGAMTRERTALESALIPVTAYILISGVECYRRYPELMQAIAAALDPADIGAGGRRPGNQVDAVHIWSIANIPLVGRQVLLPFGLTAPETDAATMATIVRFWEQAAAAFRGDGTHQAADAEPRIVCPYDRAVVDELLAGCAPVDGTDRADIARVNAALTSFCFLLYFDTRAGYQDSGPYLLDDGTMLLVRDFSEIGVSHFPWSAAVCGSMPYENVTAAFVLDGMRSVQVTDWGTSLTDPGDYLPHVIRFGLFATGRDGSLTPIAPSERTELAGVVKHAQRDLYRLIAGMTRGEKIDAGAYVYFTFLRPFAELAGVADRLDWTIPRESVDVYQAIATIDRSPEIAGDSVAYYAPLAPVGAAP